MRRIAACLLITAACLPLAAWAADEITAQVVLKVAAGNLQVQRAVNDTFSITNATPVMAGGTQTIPTNTAAAVTLGDVVNPGWTWVQNVTTNANRYVELGTGSGGSFAPFVRLYAGEYWAGPLGTAAPYALAHGGAVVIDKVINCR